jgi:hypothetical protein
VPRDRPESGGGAGFKDGRRQPQPGEEAMSAGITPTLQKGAAAIEMDTKFLRVQRIPALGERIDGWRICWLGGCDRGRIFFVVMVERKRRHSLP